MTSPSAPLTADEVHQLSPLLDTLIPADAERGLPSGAAVAFGERCADPAVLAIVRMALARLLEWGGASLHALEPVERIALVRRLERERVLEFRELLKSVVARYYVDDRVMRAIGMDPRPPFPDGYVVDEGDLTLLEPVFERGRMYRQVTSGDIP